MHNLDGTPATYYNGKPQFKEYDLSKLDYCGVEGDGEALYDWDKEVLLGFGSLIETHGYIDNPGILIEVDESDDLGDGTVRTPMLELSPEDYQYVQTVGFAHPGMLALSDTGYVYRYENDGLGGLGGRFKRFLKKVGKGIKKGWKKVGKGIKKVLKKTKFGRGLIRIGGKIKKFALKIVKPLAKFVGKWAMKLAPIAALIPGIGPAIAGAMLGAGSIAKMASKYGAKLESYTATDPKTGKKTKAYTVAAPDMKAFAAGLKSEAKKMEKMSPAKRAALLIKLKMKDPAIFSKPTRPVGFPEKGSWKDKLAFMKANAKAAQKPAVKITPAMRKRLAATSRAAAKVRALAVARSKVTPAMRAQAASAARAGQARASASRRAASRGAAAARAAAARTATPVRRQPRPKNQKQYLALKKQIAELIKQNRAFKKQAWKRKTRAKMRASMRKKYGPQKVASKSIPLPGTIPQTAARVTAPPKKYGWQDGKWYGVKKWGTA